LVKASEMKASPLVEKNKMSNPEILMIDRQAIVFLREDRSICFSTLPPASLQLAPGYTLSAWIWSALNEALETAKFSISDSEMLEIATRISQLTAELV
jgi:hypothetical protein